MIRDEKLDFWIKQGLNVLFVGKHGVGKTSTVKAAFTRNKLRWKYFSASTMDPWVDLVGVPKEKTDDDGPSYLELVRPKFLQGPDAIEALFFDEFNRSHKKVRNAVMELLQFKSINGMEFPNLKIVWAAINPKEEDDYDVEDLDPAQQDRFQVQVEIPYKPDKGYFSDKFGLPMANAAIEWWNDLNEAGKNNVSPRRLDYALEMVQSNGDVRDVLPVSTNIPKLITTIKTGPIGAIVDDFFKSQDAEKAQLFFADENNYASAIDYVVKTKAYMDFFLPLIENEKLAVLIASRDKVLKHIMEGASSIPSFAQVLFDVFSAGQNIKLCDKIRKACKKDKKLNDALGLSGSASFQKNANKNPDKACWNIPHDSEMIKKSIARLDANFGHAQNTTARKSIVDELLRLVPEHMPTERAVLILGILSKFCERSHASSTVKSLPTTHRSFIGTVNHCIDVISKNEDIGWDDIYKRYGRHFGKLCDKFLEADLAGRIAIPLAAPSAPVDGNNRAMAGQKKPVRHKRAAKRKTP